METRKGLCYRCEWRARFYESGHGPRYECQQPEHASHSCYMYKPVSPCITSKQKHDKRPRYAGAMLSAREVFSANVEHGDLWLKQVEMKNGDCLVYYKPTREEINKKNKEEKKWRDKLKKYQKESEKKWKSQN